MPNPPTDLTMVAGLVCMKLRKADSRVGIGLCERYQELIKEATELYSEYENFGPAYLADVVVEAFRAEARATYGDPLVYSTEGLAAA